MISYIIPIIIGIVVTLIGVASHRKFKMIKDKGLEAEGIIFDIEAKNNGSGSAVTFSPVVRFTTKDMEWITAESSISTFPGIYKKGQPVKIFYLENEPVKFMIDDKVSKLLPIIFIVGGLVFIIGGSVVLVKYLTSI